MCVTSGSGISLSVFAYPECPFARRAFALGANDSDVSKVGGSCSSTSLYQTGIRNRLKEGCYLAEAVSSVKLCRRPFARRCTRRSTNCSACPQAGRACRPAHDRADRARGQKYSSLIIAGDLDEHLDARESASTLPSHHRRDTGDGYPEALRLNRPYVSMGFLSEGLRYPTARSTPLSRFP